MGRAGKVLHDGADGGGGGNEEIKEENDKIETVLEGMLEGNFMLIALLYD
jgi:hypothetical protein